jgi:Probable cobalt transporter subunit (CbtA)
MARTLLIRGMLVGLVGGLLAVLFAKLFGESAVGQAIAFEGAHDRATGQPMGPELVSRTVQSTLGLATAGVVYGIAVGGFFALAFAVAHGRLGNWRPRITAAVLAAGGFLTVVVVPFVKYPADPPSVGSPDTIGHRTALYFGLLVVSVLLAVTAVDVAKRTRRRLGDWNATLLAAGLFVVAAAVVEVLLPTVDEVPDGFPASVLWHFRLASLGTQAVLWATLGLLFGTLTERALRQARRPVSSPAPSSTPASARPPAQHTEPPARSSLP